MSNEPISFGGITVGVISASSISAGVITSSQISGVTAQAQWGTVNVPGSASGVNFLPNGTAVVPGALTVAGGSMVAGSTSVGGAAEGTMWYDTSNNRLMVMANGQWCDASSVIQATHIQPTLPVPPAPPKDPEPPEPAKVHFKRKLDLDF